MKHQQRKEDILFSVCIFFSAFAINLLIWERQKATGKYEKHQEENGCDTGRKTLYRQ